MTRKRFDGPVQGPDQAENTTTNKIVLYYIINVRRKHVESGMDKIRVYAYICDGFVKFNQDDILFKCYEGRS